MYVDQDRWAEAEPLLIESLSICRNLFGRTLNNDLARSLNNIANLYIKQERWTEAEPLLIESLNIYRRLFSGTLNNDLANIINNLACLYQKQERWTQAEQLLLEALSIRRHLFSEKVNNDLAISLYNSAVFYTTQKKWTEAEPLFLQAINIYCQLYSECGHPILVDSYQDYALSLIRQKRFNESGASFATAACIDLKFLAARFQNQSESERLLYRERQQYTVDSLLSCLFLFLVKDYKVITQAFNVIYLWKSIATAVETTISETISRSQDSQLKQLASEKNKLRCQYLQITQKSPQENVEAYQEEVIRIQSRLRQIEKAIAIKIPRSELVETFIDRESINFLVPAGAILVDFVRFNLYDLNPLEKQELHYLAFILTPGGADRIQLVKLGTAAEIDELIAKFRKFSSDLPGIKMTGKFYKNDSAALLSPYHALGTQLRQAIIDPLNIPADQQEVIFAPDGDLCLVPFGILPFDNGILSDRWSIRYVSASRDLRPRSQPPAPKSQGLIAANPNYDFPTLSRIPVDDDSTASSIQMSGALSTATQKLNPLPQTESLALKIAQSLGIQPHLGNKAQVAALRNLHSPRYLIIATHGLHGLDTDSGDNPDPMLDAGLALAGYNTNLDGEQFPPELEGGLFTARDVLELDLWGTEIAILLACSSGTGIVRQGEGIFGMKRALAIAGVQTLIVSLWDVPVQASILLMDKFFELYQGGDGQPARFALHQAQSYIRNITRSELLAMEQGQIIVRRD